MTDGPQQVRTREACVEKSQYTMMSSALSIDQKVVRQNLAYLNVSGEWNFHLVVACSHIPKIYEQVSVCGCSSR